ncbi:MAG: DMT family transporter [Moorea sp. SIO2B7]|nr:DMT family transporter [Moorena sp. SIO2B7]
MTNKLQIAEKSSKFSPAIVAFIYLSIALVALSFAAIFIRLCEQEIEPNATVFNRLWIASLVFWLWNSIKRTDNKQVIQQKKKQFPDTKRELLLLLLVGIISSSSVICWAWSLTQTSVANSTILRNLCPIFTSLGAWLFLNQRFDRRFIMGMILAILGAIAIGWDDLQIGKAYLIGDTVALLAALFYAINLLILEHLRPNYTAATLLLWRCSVGTIFLLPIVLLTEDIIFPYSWQGWIMVISLAVVCQAFGQGLLVHSLNRFSSGFIAVFLLLEPVITAYLAWLIFAESLSLFNECAFVLVLGGIYLAKSSQSADKIEKIN